MNASIETALPDNAERGFGQNAGACMARLNAFHLENLADEKKLLENMNPSLSRNFSFLIIFSLRYTMHNAAKRPFSSVRLFQSHCNDAPFPGAFQHWFLHSHFMAFCLISAWKPNALFNIIPRIDRLIALVHFKMQMIWTFKLKHSAVADFPDDCSLHDHFAQLN